MNAPEILDVLVPRVEVLRPNPGDVVAISLTREMPGDMMAALANDLRRLLLEHGRSVIVSVLPPHMSIETLDEDAMLRLGWVRATAKVLE